MLPLYRAYSLKSGANMINLNKIKKLLKIFGTGFLLVILVTSCEGKKEPIPDTIGRVLLVYLGGDNNLSSEVDQKIRAIRAGWDANSGSKLLIYADKSGSNPFLYEVTQGDDKENITKTLATYDKENSASKDVFSRVIRDLQAIYPDIPSYGLVFFSHASGWLPEQTLEKPRSVGQDNGEEMKLSEFAEAIPDGLFDFIVLEACFMAGIEVAYELKDKTDYILASSAEILSPGFIDTYENSLNDLTDTSTSLKVFSEKVFKYQELAAYSSATFSLIKTSGIESLANWIINHCNFDSREIDITSIQHFDRLKGYRLFFDFEDYYSKFIDSDNLKSEFTNEINKCIIWKACTPTFLLGYNGFTINKHSGFTTYIPQDKFPFLNEEYKKTAWSKKINK